MRRILGLALISCCPVVGGSVAAAADPAVPVERTAEQQLMSLTWLEGHWQGDDLEANYSGPVGNLILSWTKNSSYGFAHPEFELIRVIDDVVTFIPYPGASRSDSDFPLLTCDPANHVVVFENLAHDWPRTFRFESPDPNTLHIVLSGPNPTAKDVPMIQEYTMTRVGRHAPVE